MESVLQVVSTIAWMAVTALITWIIGSAWVGAWRYEEGLRRGRAEPHGPGTSIDLSISDSKYRKPVGLRVSVVPPTNPEKSVLTVFLCATDEIQHEVLWDLTMTPSDEWKVSCGGAGDGRYRMTEFTLHRAPKHEMVEVPVAWIGRQGRWYASDNTTRVPKEVAEQLQRRPQSFVPNTTPRLPAP